MDKYQSQIFEPLIQVLFIHLKELPFEALGDMASENFLRSALCQLTATLSELDSALQSQMESLLDHVDNELNWDIRNNIGCIDDGPVIVE